MNTIKRSAVVGAVIALALTLSACLLTPGKFVSALDLRKDGQFTFTYKGEISMFGLAQIAAMDKEGKEFKPSTCYDDFTDSPAPAATAAAAATAGTDKDSKEPPAVEMSLPKERPCTAKETAEQKAEWEENRKTSAEREKKDLEEMKAALGGLDPTDPKSIEEFAARLRRQAGWKAVTYKGDGLFEVDYAITGKADHDFIFPIIEKFPTTNTFVQVLRRNDGTVRIDAPGFLGGSANSPMGQGIGMMGGMRMLGGLGGMGKNDMPKPAEMEGTFTLTTNSQILANNTDEGPKADPAGQKLSWTVNVRTTAAPTALVKLGN